MNKIKKILPLGLGFMPFIAMAATNIENILLTVQRIIGYVIPILIAVALIMFINGVIKYITAGADETKRAEARNTMLYGIIGLFVIVAVWGLVDVIARTFDVDTGGYQVLPKINF